jgi:hypothetical protein
MADRRFELRQNRWNGLEDTTLNRSISILLVIIIFPSLIEEVPCDARVGPRRNLSSIEYRSEPV